MSLFPAYSSADCTEGKLDYEESTDLLCSPISVAKETELLASDTEDEDKWSTSTSVAATSSGITSILPHANEYYYVDKKLDRGNLRVSTLYYPGRPEYKARRAGLNSEREQCAGAWNTTKRPRLRRYYERPPERVSARDQEEVGERVAAVQSALRDAPTDINLWMRLIYYQEEWSSKEACLAAAEAAFSRVKESAEVRRVLYRAARSTLPHQDYLTLLRDHIRDEREVAVRTELWLWMLWAVASSPPTSAAPAPPLAVLHTAAAAITDTRSHTTSTLHLQYAYGRYLQSAGLWEQLVMLIELLVAMNFPPDVNMFPPRHDVERHRAAEQQLVDYEDSVVSSGMPLSTVWCRIERARGSAHWRLAPPSSSHTQDTMDPQRRPHPADVADLLEPVVGDVHLFTLSVFMLRIERTPSYLLMLCCTTSSAHQILQKCIRLAKVPLFPRTEYMHRAVYGCGATVDQQVSLDNAEELLPVFHAARRLRRSHPPAARLLTTSRHLLIALLDPPNYFTDDYGYLSWVEMLWEACLSRASSTCTTHCTALLCWRLRWVRAQLALCTDRLEARRLRAVAKDALRKYGRDEPLAYALFARVELAAATVAGDSPDTPDGVRRALSVALQALRAAVQRDYVPDFTRLYVARVVCEMCGWRGLGDSACASDDGSTSAWAVVSAVLDRPLPAAQLLTEPPSQDLIQEALKRCEEKCEQIEKEIGQNIGGVADEEAIVWAFLPSDGEWAVARTLLRVTPAHWATSTVERASRHSTEGSDLRAMRYYEQLACVTCARAPLLARILHPLYKNNAYLALLREMCPMWRAAGGGECAAVRRVELCSGRGDLVTLITLLTALVAMDDAEATGAVGWERMARVARRTLRDGVGGGLVWSLRLEAEGRAWRGELATLKRALYGALDHRPYDKWMHVRGAQWLPSEGDELCDMLLEKQLRLHALRDELLPPTTPAPVLADSSQNNTEPNH